MKLALVILLFAAGALAQDVPLEQLHALLDYDRSAVGRVFVRMRGPRAVALSELFGDKGQLIIQHFMFEPNWDQGCKSCSFMADHLDPSVVHVAHRDVAYAAVSKAPLEKLEAFKKRMG